MSLNNHRHFLLPLLGLLILISPFQNEPTGHRSRADSFHADRSDFSGLHRHDTFKSQGLELVKLLRVSRRSSIGQNLSIKKLRFQDAEHFKYSADEVQIALIYCGDQHPIEWLRQNWQKTINSVQTLATQMGRESPMNIVGTVSETEAKDALRLHNGNIWPAVTECVEQRQKKVR